jgi:DNA helicase-4
MANADEVNKANQNFAHLTGLSNYFSNYDEQVFLGAYRELRRVLKTRIDNLGLPPDYIVAIQQFQRNFDQSTILRQQYNSEFVAVEKDRYATFFDQLEDYPLSQDQVESIIRDEDNNLVIAGAGTGKTTTISGKIAYLLEKKLATPEELLVISFTKNAVREMYDRCLRFCKHIPGAEGLEVRTFNSYGFLVSRICSSREILLAFDGDDEKAKAFLQQQFEELFVNDGDFQKKVMNFLAFFKRPNRDEFTFETMNDYLNYEESFKNVTLDGVKVESKEEMEIANFFCLFGINYEYQRHFELNEEDRNPTYGAYRPDFYLPEYEIWHEHFGIARNGDVPKWFQTRPPYPDAREYYHAGIKWKEDIHKKYGTKLIRTYSYENHEGSLISNLKKRLLAEGISLQPRSAEELLDLVQKSDGYEDFMTLIYTFLGLMKSNGKKPAEFNFKRSDKRFSVFLDVFKPLYQSYEGKLKQSNAIDFNDMISHAAEHFKNGRFTKSYKYILVDEFQDMSQGRYKLLQDIRHQNPGVKIYAVGDDWQSIFRFTGSDISIITEFERQFGFTSQSTILKTYRFHTEILKASSDFIQKNPAQIRKQLTAHAAPEGQTSFVFVDSSGYKGFKEGQAAVLNNILQEITSLRPNANVFLIGRYKFNVPHDLAQLPNSFPGLTLSYHTAYGVKGMTCDFAILLSVNSGVMGFPSEMADDPLLNYLLHEGDSFENAEERRVFYVAITRARFKNYLIYDETQPSKFLIELQQATGFIAAHAAQKCPECQGPMIRRTGPFSNFYGCTHYPRCTGKLPIAAPTVSTV